MRHNCMVMEIWSTGIEVLVFNNFFICLNFDTLNKNEKELLKIFFPKGDKYVMIFKFLEEAFCKQLEELSCF